MELAVYGAVFLAGFCLTLGVGYTLFWERMAVLERLEHYTKSWKDLSTTPRSARRPFTRS